MTRYREMANTLQKALVLLCRRTRVMNNKVPWCETGKK
jgi:hypothetical protein